MSDVDELLSRLPIGDIANQLGTDEASARAAAAQAIPALLTGLQAQTQDENSAQRLASALEQHDNDLAQGTIDLGDVDTDDGSKIVANIFGNQTDQVAGALSEQVPAASVDQGLIKKTLPILAPIVLSFLVRKITGGAGNTTNGGGDLGSVLGGALGGGGGAAGGLGSVLGGILGGGSAGGLGDLLGSILGGRK
ncbi:DUF937 domain-containing protein [Gordonia sp. NPDC003585]|uniref:DUF937 domain-containing protein n=1 Tax=Gordonia sp. NPDC003585 TaxID=3154275 RepID=UPI0033A43E47